MTKNPYVRIKVKKLHPDARLPTYGSAEAAGADVYALGEDFEGELVMFGMQPGQRRLVRTGIAIELPEGFEVQVRPRSGLALKKGVTVLNTPGTVDSDYRGEIGVILFNAGQEDFWVEPGDRIAQLVVKPVVRGTFCEVEELGSSDRGAGGFGSTGTK